MLCASIEYVVGLVLSSVRVLERRARGCNVTKYPHEAVAANTLKTQHHNDELADLIMCSIGAVDGDMCLGGSSEIILYASARIFYRKA